MKNLLHLVLYFIAFGALAGATPILFSEVPEAEIDTDGPFAPSDDYRDRRLVMPANDFCAGAIPISPATTGARCTVSGFTLPFSTDGTTDSGVPTTCTDPGRDQWFTWTATTDGLYFSSDDQGDPGIAVFASCADANAGNALDCINPINSGILSGWNVGDELLIQIYDGPTSFAQDVVFCLEEVTVVTSPTPPVNDLCAGAIPIMPQPASDGCATPGFFLPFASDGTTDSGVPIPGFVEPGNDQWFTWTATSPVLDFSSKAPGYPGIAIFASCADVDASNEIAERPPLEGSEQLSGWDVGDELIIQIYTLGTSSTSDVAFCLEDPTATDEPPVARCVNVFTVQINENGNPQLTPEDLNNGSSDDFTSAEDLILEIELGDVAVDCSVANQLFIPDPRITLRVTDGAGQSSTCTSGVRVRDDIAPQLVCQDVTLALDPATGTINLAEVLVDAAVVSVTDNCGTPDVFIRSSDLNNPPPNVLNCDDIGTTSRTLFVGSNAGGPLTTCDVTITVADVSPPVVSCQNVVVELDDNGSFPIFLDFSIDVTLVDFEDNCATAPTSGTIIGGSRTFVCDDLGVATRTFTYRDGNGQQGRCNGIRFQVSDPVGGCAEAPNVNCQPVSELVADAAVPVSVNANAFDDGSTDDDGVYSLGFNPETDRQESINRDCNITGEGLGMTFRPGQTGVIQYIKVRSGTAVNTMLHLYEGNVGSGISGEVGTPDYSQPAELFFGQYGHNANLTTILLDEPFPVVEGQVYSFILEGETTLSRNCDGTPNNSGGRTLNNFADKDLNSTQDLTFQVNVIGETTREFSGIGTFPVTVFAVDEQGNVSEGCETTFTLNQEGPMANCQPTAVAQVDAEGSVQLDPNDLDNGSTNGDGSTDGLVFSLDFGDVSFDCNAVGESAEAVTLVVTDATGLTDNCTSQVTVADNIEPVISCQDTIISIPPETGSINLAILANELITGSDNCSVASTQTVFGTGRALYNCADFNAGRPARITRTIRDRSNNEASCTATITVNDLDRVCDEAPVARCVAPFTVEIDENGNSNLTPADLNDNSSDLETPTEDLLFSFDATQGEVDCDNLGITSVSLIVTDNVGQSDTCFTQVTVEDNLPPEATCQNVAVELDDSERFGLSLGFARNVILADFVDNCATLPTAVNFNGGSSAFNCNDLGGATRNFFYLDGNGNQDLCNGVRFQVTDPLGVCGEDPVVSCSPATVTVDNLAETPAVVNANEFDNGSTDDGSVYTLVYSDATDRQENTVFDCSSTGFDQGQTFTAGQTGVIQSISVRSGAAMNTEIHLYDGNLANDPAVDPGLPDYSQDVELFFGQYFNRANLSVMTLDEPFPVVAGQEYTFVLDLESTLSRSCAGSADYAGGQPITGLMPQDDPGGQDFTFEVNIIGPTTQEFDSIGVFPVTVFAVDDQGNVSEGCETTVRVGQLTPIARCSTSVVAQLDENGAVNLSPSDLDSLSLTGNPPSMLAESLTFTFGSDISNLNCNAARDRTVIPVTLEVTRANGRSDNCVSMVTVQDTIPPVLVCREELVVPIDPETGIARFRSADAVISNVDNCGIRTLSSSGSPNFVCGDIGRIITKTVRTSDQSSNLSTCEVTVTITDPENFCPTNTPPTAVCRPTVEVFVQPDLTVPFAVNFLNDGSNDAESANNTLTLTLLEEDFAGFSCADVDQPRTLSLIVTDPQGLSDTCSTEFIILDPNLFCDEPPVAVCVESFTVELDGNSNATLNPADLGGGSFDEVTPTADLVFTLDRPGTTFDCDDIGIQTVGLIVTDNIGKTDTCFTQVTTTENTPPVFENCPANITVNTDPGLCFATVDFATPTILFDPCDFPNSDLSLEGVLARYNNNIDALLAAIPNRFVLEEDIDNNDSFGDGGDDAYDTGNFMNTDFATEIQYSENIITTSNDFGTNSAYFTAYNAGVWMMAADVVDLTFYEINGELGA
ncbi:MAG: hypothetical protein AAFN92_00015, partial [Bacteroidota bacterium]